MVYVAPIYFIPMFFNILLTKARLMPKTMGIPRILIECCFLTISMGIAMPVNCALYPQQSMIAVADVEPEI